MRMAPKKQAGLLAEGDHFASALLVPCLQRRRVGEAQSAALGLVAHPLVSQGVLVALASRAVAKTPIVSTEAVAI